MNIFLLTLIFTYISSPMAEMRVGPSENEKVDSQAIHSERVEILEERGDWIDIKTLENYNMTRCMETVHINTASDRYFSASLEECTNCIFSFNQRNKHYLIGNLALEKEKHAQLKGKILEELADELKRKKKVPSIIDIIGLTKSNNEKWRE